MCLAIKLSDQVLQDSLWLLFFTRQLLACNSGFVGSFAAHPSGMRRWPLKWYIVFLTCFKTKGLSASPLPISCRSVCHGTYASAESVLWLTCSVFIFYPCEYSEASGINLMDKSICESRNRLSNPQNLVLVQFKLKKKKSLRKGAYSFWFCILSAEESMGGWCVVSD